MSRPPPESVPIRVLVAEDEQPVREALCDLLASETGIEIAGAAAHATEAIELAEMLRPDVALLDVRMPGGGPQAARGIAARSPDTRVLALSAYDDQATVLEMLRAGAVGYLVKGISPVEIVEAVLRAARGQATLSIEVISGVVEELASDLDERREVAEVMRRSEARFRDLLESAPDAVVVVHDDGSMALVNAQTEMLFGYTRGELLGRPVETLLPERFHVGHLGHRAAYLADPRTRPMGASLDLAGRRRDGSEFPVDISLSAIETEEGRLVTAFIRDVTERHAAEEVRRAGEERFGTLLELAPDAVVISDAAGQIVLVNSKTEKMFGYDRDELLGTQLDTLLPEGFRERHIGYRAGYIVDPLTRPMGADLHLVANRKDGSEFPVDISLATMETDEGRLVTAFVRDITDRREGENASRQLAAIVESSDDAIIGKDLSGTILSWNLGAERMYGYSAADVLGKSVSILLPPNHPDELPEIIERLKRGEEVEQVETTRKRRDGVDVEVTLKISAIRDLAGRIVGSSTIARDMTQVKQRAELERDLAQRRALLAHIVAAGEEERRRIADDIHDDSIQAITAAGMRLQILRRSMNDEEQLALLDDLEQTIQLSIARLRHLLFELRPPVLDNEGLSAALEMYVHEAERDAGISYEVDDRLRSQPASETRIVLYRIVQEALNNVRKHAKASKVTILMRDRDGGFLVRVSDDGVGFAADAEKPAPGHLGLAAMHERAALAGGWFRVVEAAPGSGAAVEVWIPAAVAEGGPPSGGDHSPAADAGPA